MEDKPNEFALLMERLAQGDQQAAAELYNKYHKAVLRVIRYRLERSPQLRTQFDSADFEQMVWAEMFAQLDKVRDFAGFQDFLQYLAKLAYHKVEKARRKHLGTQKRDLRRTRQLSDSDVGGTGTAIADPRPGPDVQASTHEQWEQWLLSLPLRHRSVVVMLRDGHSYEAIAETLGCSVRSIDRVVVHLRCRAPLSRRGY